MSSISMVDLKSQYLDISKEIDLAISKVINSTSFINGAIVGEFESNLADWNNSKHVIGCANGTDGLQIALMALDLEPGDEIIVPSFTYVATVEVIALLKLTPVFVDVLPDSFNIDISKLEASITSKTKAIIPVHLYGQCAEMDEINAIANSNNLFVIEDLAQAIGSKYKDRLSGNLSHIGVTSFFPSKNLGCYGDGGALITNDDEIAKKIRVIGNHGQSKKYYHDVIGVNSRLDSMQAAILNEKLKHLDDYTSNRQKAAEYYDKNLNTLSGITIPGMTINSTHVYHQYTIKVLDGKRDELKSYLMSKGIPSMIYYPLPVNKQLAYSGYSSKAYEVTNTLCTQVLSLPMHTHLNEEQLNYICQQITEYYHG